MAFTIKCIFDAVINRAKALTKLVCELIARKSRELLDLFAFCHVLSFYSSQTGVLQLLAISISMKM